MIKGKLRIKPLCVAAALSAVGLGLGLHQEYATAVAGKHNKVTIVNNSGVPKILMDIYTFNRRGRPARQSHNETPRVLRDPAFPGAGRAKTSLTLKCNRRRSKRNNNIDYCSLKVYPPSGNNPLNIDRGRCKVRNGKKYEVVRDPANDKKLICNEL